MANAAIERDGQMGNDEGDLEHEGEEVDEFGEFLEKYSNSGSNLYECNSTTIRGPNFVIIKTAPRSGKKKRRDIVSNNPRTQCDRVHDLLFKVNFSHLIHLIYKLLIE